MKKTSKRDRRDSIIPCARPVRPVLTADALAQVQGGAGEITLPALDGSSKEA